MPKQESYFLFPLLIVLTTGIWSAIQPYDLFTWVLEAVPIIVLLLIIVLLWSRFPLTPLSCWLIALGMVLVLIGAHYTYARMPVFEWLKELFGFSRNHYDRFGHFFQGFIPAIIFRELLLRTSSIGRGVWLWVIVTALCMAKSVCYEFAEWWTAIIVGEDAHDFLAMQGDEWDAQKDMLWATIGSIMAMATLPPLHDRQLEKWLH